MRVQTILLIFLLCLFPRPSQGQTFGASWQKEWTAALDLWNSGNTNEGLAGMIRVVDSLSSQVGVLPREMCGMEYTLGDCFFSLGKFDLAILHAERADAWWKKAGFPRRVKEIVNLDKLLCMSAYKAMQYEKAAEWGDVWREDARRIFSKYSPSYVLCLYVVGCAKFQTGNYVESRDHLQDLVELYEEYGKETISEDELFQALVFLSICHTNLGANTSSLACLDQADALIEKQGRNDWTSAGTKMLRGSVYMACGENDLAIDAFEASKELLEIYDPELEDENAVSFYLSACLCLAGLYIQDEALQEESLDLFVTILETLETLDGDYDLLYARTLAQYGMWQMVLEDWDAGGALLCEADDLLMEIHPTYSQEADFMWTKIMKELYLLGEGEDEALLAEAELVSALLCERLFESFPFLVESEREQFWGEVNPWYTMALPTLARANPRSELSELCFNGVLQSKGILLNSSLNIDRMLKVANNETLDNLQAQRLRAKELLPSSSDEGLQFANYTVVDKLERRLLRELQPYGNFMADLHITADSVRKALKSYELAVEFLAVENWGEEDTTYIALTLKRDYEYPHLYELCSRRDLEALMKVSNLTNLDETLYALVWGGMAETEFAGVESIYFAADGLLYAIPIEYCLTPDGRRMMEKYECMRVSSTRELCRPSEPSSGEGKVVAYGNVDYNASFEEIREALEKVVCRESLRTSSSEIEVVDTIPRSMFEDLRTVDGGFGKLSFSGPEINAIDSLCGLREIACEVYDSCRASEESVKLLVSPRVLHFATHGVYFTPQAARSRSYLNRIIEKTEPLNEPLVRSALILAGVNKMIKNGCKPGMEDGILTARDISTIDLRGTKLVVLSACNSGLGDIGSDGVFGLQRGFKQAGAESILMSLVSVNDYVAYIFVQAFFERYFAHGSSTLALREAQRFVQETEEGRWRSPEFWAPFILLDAIH